MAIPATARVTRAEYLDFERGSEARHELIDGEIVAMSGASARHVTISGNLLAALHARLRAGGWRCRPYHSDMRVRVGDGSLYTYPDLSVVCGTPELEDDFVDTLLNPTLIVEVLSPTTARYDRSEKWIRYRSIATLREYLLVEQDRVHVERFLRQDDGTWVFSETSDPAATLSLPSIGCDVPLAEIYEGVEPTTPPAA